MADDNENTESVYQAADEAARHLKEQHEVKKAKEKAESRPDPEKERKEHERMDNEGVIRF